MAAAFIFCTFVLLKLASTQDTDPIIETTGGLVRGHYVPDRTGENATYYAFQGIPYAEPPVGDLRWRPSVAKTPWSGVLNATQFGNNCVQFGIPDLMATPFGDEDCLFINVFTPELPREDLELKPVLFWIHGGQYILGSGDVGPDFLIVHDIVIVTFNYRLDIFGYLTTQDEVAPGNLAIKDKILALHWVQDNIAAFGGDPDKVTISGISSGSTIVQYLLQSPLTEGLFRGAISFSGSTLDVWTLQQNPRSFAFQVGRGFGIETNDSLELIDGLREINATDLITGGYVYTHPLSILEVIPWAPSIETQTTDAALIEPSFKSISEGNYRKVPYFLGTVSAEGLLVYNYYLEGLLNITDYIADPRNLISLSLNINPESEIAEAAGTQIRDYYYGSYPELTIENFVTQWNDEAFRRGVRKSVELMKNEVPVYYYIFTYQGSTSTSSVGVNHGGDLPYLWYYGLNETDQDRLVRQREAKLVANFVKTLNPTPEEDPLFNNITWLPAGEIDHYLEIGSELIPGIGYQNDHFEFWSEIFEEFGNTPFNTW